MRRAARFERLAAAWRRHGTPFDPRAANNFDLLRFAAATLVLVDHSLVLSGRQGLPGPFGYETLGGFAVAVFFVVSGFLVAGSWQRAPRLGAYAAKRALRIVPAYAVVIALAALVLGPAVSELAPGAYFRNHQTWAYFRNLSYYQLHYALPGVFTANPYPNAVNGSIWTLPIELAMYVVLAALGWARLLNRTVVVALVIALALASFGWQEALLAAPPILFATLPAYYTAHLGLWFFLGSALWLHRERIRYRHDVALLLLFAVWMTQGTTAGTLIFHAALPYLVIWAAQLRIPVMNRFGRYGDFSYGMYLYAFPLQQALAWLGGARWPYPGYVAACFGVTLLCAVASWHLVERPALRLKVLRPAQDGGKRSDAGLIARKVTEPGRT